MSVGWWCRRRVRMRGRDSPSHAKAKKNEAHITLEPTMAAFLSLRGWSFSLLKMWKTGFELWTQLWPTCKTLTHAVYFATNWEHKYNKIQKHKVEENTNQSTEMKMPFMHICIEVSNVTIFQYIIVLIKHNFCHYANNLYSSVNTVLLL